MVITFVLLAAIIFGFLGMIWERDTLLNAVIKTVFLVMTVWGVGIILSNSHLFLVPT